jgi:transposase InsO family protein
MKGPTTGLTAVLRAGGWLVHDGERHQIVELCGRRVLLQSSTGGLRQVDVAWLLAHPTTRIGGGGEPPGPSLAAAFASLGAAQDAELTTKIGHVQEVLTGYQHGSPELAQDGEPRPQYAPGTPKMVRYQAKAAELGVSVMTVRRWVAAFASDGPAGLLGNPNGRGGGPLGRTDPRWVDIARAVLAEHVSASRPTRDIILAKVEARLVEAHGAGTVAVPARSTAYQLLRELSRGTGAFEGATKAKRSIANRPVGVYGRLRATRPGEYVLLDTTRLDVFAMEPVTCRWVQAELTAAMDLYSRCITGLRLTPISTKSVDVAAVLFETVRPRTDRSAAEPADALVGGREPLPYHGTPGSVVVDARKLVDAAGRLLLPAVAAETIVYDHGKVYLSNHIQGVCERLGISLQPARPKTPTDKSPLERWFETLADQLLVALPGYKGADVHSRGEDVEQQAWFFLDELEQVIRQWIGGCYHRNPHRGLVVPEVPGLELSPLEMFEHGVTRAGQLVIPARPDLAFDFLKVEWRPIHHYGVEVGTLRYNGPALTPYRNSTSSYHGAYEGKWPFSIDPGDVSRIYFQDPADNRWHVLEWEHAQALGKPFSQEALGYARALAAKTHRFPDTKRALAELLDRWGAGLTANPTERRMAVRLSQERLRLIGDAATQAGTGTRQAAAVLPTAQQDAQQDAARQVREGAGVAADTAAGDAGDDDDDSECDAAFPGEDGAGLADEDDFYADAWETR